MLPMSWRGACSMGSERRPIAFWRESGLSGPSDENQPGESGEDAWERTERNSGGTRTAGPPGRKLSDEEVRAVYAVTPMTSSAVSPMSSWMALRASITNTTRMETVSL